MSVLWRILGFHVVAEAARRLPERDARRVTLALLVISNLLPIVGVWEGWMTAPDVFLAYWLETVVIGVMALVRICTATGGEPVAVKDRVGSVVMFTLLFGVLTFLHGVLLQMLFSGAAMFAETIHDLTGWGDPGDFELSGGNGWVWVTVGLVISHVVALVMHWFIRGERRVYDVQTVMFAPFGRVLALQALVSIDVFVLMGLLVVHEVILVVLLVAVKLLVDLAPRLLERFVPRKLKPTVAFVREKSAGGREQLDEVS